MSAIRSTLQGRDHSKPLNASRPVGLLPSAHADRSPLFRTYHAALANRPASPIDIVCVGDSITTGAGASTLQTRWIARMRDQLRIVYQPAGVAGGDGYSQLNTTYNTPWAITGTTAPSNAAGLGEGALSFAVSGDAASRTFTGTGVDVFFTKQSGGGTFSVSIDGGAATNINTSNATTINGVSQRFGGLIAGPHTIAISWVSGASLVEGVMIYNGDEVKGIRVWDGGRTGIPAANYVTYPQYIGAITTIQPALVIVFLGTNDWRLNKPISGHATNLTTIINAIRAACTIPPTVLLVAPYITNTTPTTVPFLGLYDALYQAAGVLGDVDILDLYQKFGPNIQTASLGLLAGDGIHPSDKGHQFIADAIIGRLAP